VLTLDAVEVAIVPVQHEVEADLARHGVRRAAPLHPPQHLQAHQQRTLSRVDKLKSPHRAISPLEHLMHCAC